MANPWDVGGAWTPQTWGELADYAGNKGWSEDYARFYSPDQRDSAIGGDWLNYWDPNQRKFRTSKKDAQGNAISGWVEKPDETPEGWTAWGDYAIPTSEAQSKMSGWGGGATGGGGGAASGGPMAGWGQFQTPAFQAPSLEALQATPGYQARLQEGLGAVQNSALARGAGRTGQTLRDLMDYGQQHASNEYNNLFGQQLQGWQANLQPTYGAWNTQFGAGENRWNTQYGGQLTRDMQRENAILALLGGGAPQFPTGF